MRPDALVTWPTNCDFPIWRAWLRAERPRFKRVIVVFSPHPGRHDFRPDVKCWLRDDGVEFYEAPSDREWRDAAVNAALDRSDADWAWFTEQDLLIHDPFFWTIIDNCVTHGARMIGVRRDERWHPCCLFVRREDVDRTSRYFGPEPVDHFWAFGRELEAARVPRADLDEWMAGRGIYTHLAGLSRNHQIIDGWSEGRYPLAEEIYHPEELAPYLRLCLREPGLEGGWRRHAGLFLDWYASRSG